MLGFLAVFIFLQIKKGQDAELQAKLDQIKKDDDARYADLQNKQQPTVAETPTNMRNVYYATQPIEPGVKLSPALFEKKPTPTDILPDAYPESTDVASFYAIRPIEKGDPLSPHNAAHDLPYMSQRVKAGMRAVSLPIFNADVNNTGGFAVDGDKVDILFSTMSLDSSLILKTEMLMQNLEILYIPGPKVQSDQTAGIQPSPPPGDAVAVTFQVSPEQAQALIFLSQVKNGRFSMILRARKDKDEQKFKPFIGSDYAGNLGKVQKMTDKSYVRVQELQQKIEEQEKAQAASQGTTNETKTPTPPTP